MAYTDYFEGYGYLVIIDHGLTYYSLYGHLSSEFLVKKGDFVKEEQPIATVGEFGSLKEETLYFEIREKTDPVNPLSPTQMAPLPNQRLNTIGSTPGHIRFATVWRADVPLYTYSGDSVAARITFRIIYCPPQTEVNNTISCLLTLDPFVTFGTDLTGNRISILEFNNGYYEYATLVKLVGDVDGDLDVDLDDQHQIQLAMFTLPGDPSWNPYADIAEDFDVDVGDQRKHRLNMFGSY